MTALLGWCRMEFTAALMPQDNPLGSTESRAPRDRSEADGSPSGSAESKMDTPRGSGVTLDDRPPDDAAIESPGTQLGSPRSRESSERKTR